VSRLLPIARDAIFNPSEILFREGAKSENLYLIIAGSVALESMVNGRPMRVQTLHAGDATGWSAFFESSHTHFQARAITQVSCVAFSGGELRAACDRDPSLGYAFLQQLLGLVTERLDAVRMQMMQASPARA
jgi:CRP-like cAMP-binding protein